MITMHSVSAAYVKARQAEEQQAQPKPAQPVSYEPHCEMSWATSVSAVDETACLTQDNEQVK